MKTIKKCLKSTFSKEAMVTSPHTAASEAGLEILRRGGTAIEASIAIAAKLSVTYPHFNGLGGDAFLIMSTPNGDVMSISGIGQAFEKLPDFSEGIATRGINSAITTACTVDAWGKAYLYSKQKWGGTIPWKDLFTPAIKVAQEGYKVSNSQEFWYDFRKNEMQNWQGFHKTFSNKGKCYKEGDLLKQNELANTLTAIANYGHREFYEGKLAEKIVHSLQKMGSFIQLSDLKRTHARLELPLKISYRDGELYSLQPPTQGITTLQIMGILNCLDLKKIAPLNTPDFYHYIIEAIKLAFLDRNKLIADPEFCEKNMLNILENIYLADQAQSILPKTARMWNEKFQQGDTAYIGVVDTYGNCVSMLQTIYYDWGSGVVVDDTGILWHNRGSSFSNELLHHNSIQPYKRPFHTLNPGIFLKNKKPFLLFGTQGADGQPQTLATLLVRLIDFNLSPYSALQQPRFLLGKTFSSQEETLKIEEDATQETIKALSSMGHKIEIISAQSQLAGHAGVIKITEEGILAAHDSRSDGIALGL